MPGDCPSSIGTVTPGRDRGTRRATRRAR